jgi:hypothetical protein
MGAPVANINEVRIRVSCFEELNVLLGGLNAFPGAYKSFTEAQKKDVAIVEKIRFIFFNFWS